VEQDGMKIQKNAKLVMTGDSVTDAGRTQPVGEGLFDPMGRGYVTMVDSLLGVAYPGRGVRVVNMGLSGNTVKDLSARWQRDVLDLKPDWVSIGIGINDVWRQFDSPTRPEAHVLPDEYEQTYRQLLRQTRSAVTGLVLLTPFYIEPNRSDPLRRRMDEYGAIVRRLAGEFDALFVDVQAAMDALLSVHHSAAIAWDRVHPNQVGHMAIARAFLNEIGFDWQGE
jgi:lysophospholipase L1-like esterase